MSIWSWFFPSEQDRIERAKGWMEQKDFAEARLGLMGIDNPDAQALLATCEQELCRANLLAAVSWAEAGDQDRVEHHLQVADNFRGPGLEEEFREARRLLREARASRKAEVEAEAESQRQSAEGHFVPEQFRDTSFPEAADDESTARLALIVESYEETLKSSVGELGSVFAVALLDLEDGKPAEALEGLVQLPGDSAVVRYERARASYAMGDAAATSRELLAFRELHGSHVNMGKHHTGLFLATAFAEQGRLDDALALLGAERKVDPTFGAGLYAQLLEATGELDEAEKVLVGLVRVYSKDSGLYALLGRVRAKAGNRRGAMTTLEAGLEACACSPGQCGYRPPDVRVIRSLATLYLEDGVETQRGLELANQAAGLVQQPAWDDVYLQALAARSSGAPDAKQLAASLRDHTPDGDARGERITKYLPAPA